MSESHIFPSVQKQDYRPSAATNNSIGQQKFGSQILDSWNSIRHSGLTKKNLLGPQDQSILQIPSFNID